MSNTNCRPFNTRNASIYICIILFGLLQTAFAIYYPFMISDYAILIINGEIIINDLIFPLIILLSFLVISFVRKYTEGYLGMKLELDIKKFYFQKFAKATYTSYLKADFNKNYQIIFAEVKQISLFITRTIPQLIFDLIICVVVLTIIFRTSLLLGWIMLAISLLFSLYVIVISKQYKELKNINVVDKADYYNNTLAHLQLAKTVKLFTLVEYLKDLMKQKVEKIFLVSMKMIYIDISIEAISNLLRYAITIYVLFLISSGKYTISLYIFMEQYIIYFTNSLMRLGKVLESYRDYEIMR